MLVEVNLLHRIVEPKVVKINKSRSLDYWYVQRRLKCELRIAGLSNAQQQHARPGALSIAAGHNMRGVHPCRGYIASQLVF